MRDMHAQWHDLQGPQLPQERQVDRVKREDPGRSRHPDARREARVRWVPGYIHAQDAGIRKGCAEHRAAGGEELPRE